MVSEKNTKQDEHNLLSIGISSPELGHKRTHRHVLPHFDLKRPVRGGCHGR